MDLELIKKSGLDPNTFLYLVGCMKGIAPNWIQPIDLDTAKELGYVNDENIITDNFKILIQLEEKFEEFWKEYPSLGGSNPLKINRPRCKSLYFDLLSEGVDHTLILKALIREKNKRKLKGDMQYMCKAENYLTSRVFEAYMEEEESKSDTPKKSGLLNSIIKMT